MLPFGHSIPALAISNTAATIRSKGRNGLKNAKLILMPKRETGSSKHTGHRSATAPIVPPMPDALFAPRGHVPILFLQLSSPAFSERRAIRSRVNTISCCVGSGRGGLGICGNIPSSHAKKRLQSSSAPSAQLQKSLLRTNFHCMDRIMNCVYRSYQGNSLSTCPKHIPETYYNCLLCTAGAVPDIPMRQKHVPVSILQYCNL